MPAGPQKPKSSTTSVRNLSLWERFLEDSSFLRHYAWKYRKFVTVGLLALVLVDLMEIIPPILLKNAVDIAVGDKPRQLLIIVALTYVGVSFLQAVGRYGW